MLLLSRRCLYNVLLMYLIFSSGVGALKCHTCKGFRDKLCKETTEETCGAPVSFGDGDDELRQAELNDNNEKITIPPEIKEKLGLVSPTNDTGSRSTPEFDFVCTKSSQTKDGQLVLVSKGCSEAVKGKHEENTCETFKNVLDNTITSTHCICSTDKCNKGTSSKSFLSLLACGIAISLMSQYSI